MIYEFGWPHDGWDRIAAGIVAGHINECGAQATGGNTGVDWESLDYVNIGYPSIEAYPNGEFVVTKHVTLGGRVTVATVTEQLVYEMGDPSVHNARRYRRLLHDKAGTGGRGGGGRSRWVRTNNFHRLSIIR